jgi:hypothetical protein
VKTLASKQKMMPSNFIVSFGFDEEDEGISG